MQRGDAELPRAVNDLPHPGDAIVFNGLLGDARGMCFVIGVQTHPSDPFKVDVQVLTASRKLRSFVVFSSEGLDWSRVSEREVA